MNILNMQFPSSKKIRVGAETTEQQLTETSTKLRLKEPQEKIKSLAHKYKCNLNVNV